MSNSAIDDTAADDAGAAPHRRGADGRLFGMNPRRAVILAVALAVVALTLAVPLRTYFSQRSEAAHVQAQNSQLRDQVADLQKKRALQQDPAYIAEQARKRLLLAKPGETPLIIDYPQPPEKTDDQKRAEKQAANPWYTNLFGAVATPPSQ